jgi:glycosyltransferase involved in cell wall biosynthesis
VFLEAMAAGLPVVCYDHGGQTDFLEDGKTGRVLRLEDEDAMVAALDELAADRGARERIRAFNREKVEDYFIDTCARRYEALFEEVVRKARGLPAIGPKPRDRHVPRAEPSRPSFQGRAAHH